MRRGVGEHRQVLQTLRAAQVPCTCAKPLALKPLKTLSLHTVWRTPPGPSGPLRGSGPLHERQKWLVCNPCFPMTCAVGRNSLQSRTAGGLRCRQSQLFAMLCACTDERALHSADRIGWPGTRVWGLKIANTPDMLIPTAEGVVAQVEVAQQGSAGWRGWPAAVQRP